MKLVAAMLGLLGGQLLSLAAVIALGSMLFLGLVPIPAVRSLLAAIQRLLVSQVTDTYLLATKPIERSSIATQVGRDLEWLAARCDRVAIIGFGEGAATAFESISQQAPRSLGLFLTFGSALRKVWELREILGRQRKFRTAGIYTLLSTAAFLLYGGALASHYLRLGADPSQTRALGAGLFEVFFFACITAGGLYVASFGGFRDFFRGVDLSELRSGMARLTSRGVRWVDLYAVDDWIPNGPILDGRETKKAAGVPKIENLETIEVHNHGEIGTAYVTYWQNRDGFVARVVAALAAEAKAEPLFDLESVEETRLFRRWRVRWLAAARWVALVGGAAVILRYPGECWKLVRYPVLKSWSLVEKLFSDTPASVPAPAFVDIRHALLLSSSVLFAYLIVLWVWRRWDEAAMEAQGRVELPETPVAFFTLFTFELAFAAGVVLGTDDYVGELLFGSFVIVFAFWLVWDKTRKGSVLKPPPREDFASAPYAHRALRNLHELSKPVALSLGLGLLSFKALNFVWPRGIAFGISTIFPASAMALIVFVALLVRMARGRKLS